MKDNKTRKRRIPLNCFRNNNHIVLKKKTTEMP